MGYIEVSDLTKEYLIQSRSAGLKGALKDLFSKNYSTKNAVDSVSFSISKGESVGYIGPNGAGKSTTIKMLTGIIAPTSGKLAVNGMIPWQNREKYVKKIGILYGNRGQMWNELSPYDSYDLLRKIYEVDKGAFKENLKYFSEELMITDLLNRPLRELSLGQRMRCELAAIFLHSPEVVFLDEPTIGLDFEVKKSIRKLLKKLNKEKGTTIIFTSHDLHDIEEVCEKLMIIDSGSLVYDGQLQDLRQKFSSIRRIKINVLNDAERSMLLSYLQNYTESGLKYDTHMDEVNIHFSMKSFPLPQFIAEISHYESVSNIVIEDSKIEDMISNILREGRVEDGLE